MFKRLMNLFKSAESAEADSSEIVELADRDEWYREKEGFPRARWASIEEYVNLHYEVAERPAARRQALRNWLQRVCQAMREQGHIMAVVETKGALVLASGKGDGLNALARAVGEVRRRIWDTLGDVAWLMPTKRLVVINLPDQDSYYRYVSHYYGQGEFAGSGGIAIMGDCPHIVLPNPQSRFSDATTAVLAHETAHIAVSHLNLPRWLDEAIAMNFEALIGGRSTDAAAQLLETRQLQQYWTPSNIQEFWSGDSFFSAKNKDNEMSYALARTLFGLLHSQFRPSPEDFRSFVKTADASDAGEDASMCCFARSLTELTEIFLGPGDWEPRLAK